MYVATIVEFGPPRMSTRSMAGQAAVYWASIACVSQMFGGAVMALRPNAASSSLMRARTVLPGA